MPRDNTQYTVIQDEPDLADELQELDWSNGNAPPVQEAAALIHEMWSNPEAGDERGIYELLTEVPSEFRNEVLATVLRENMSAQEWQATEAPAEPTDESRPVAERAESYRSPEPESDDAATRHQAEARLQHDLERTQHMLQYVESIGSADMAYQLGKVMQDSRNLSLRRLRGDPATYGNDPHERYVQCIIDIPATLDAKQAMDGTQWDEARLREAVQHEVNRMAYRLNLEIQDRLLEQFANNKLKANVAKQQSMSEEVVERLNVWGNNMAQYAEGRRNKDNPTYETIRDAAYMYVIELGLRTAIKQKDEAALMELTKPSSRKDGLEKRARQAASYVRPEVLDTINEAAAVAAQWPAERIVEGAADYHAKYAELEYDCANQAREDWLTTREDAASRDTRTGDCVTRALNEATGGMNYGTIWQEITERTKTQYPKQDADRAVADRHHRDVYLEHGMQPILEATENMSHIMRRHLDLREIPALIGHLFEDPGKPLTYIALSEGHAVAVVDGRLKDIWDSREMGDRTKYRRDHTLVGLWIRCDEQSTVDAAKEIIDRYAEVRCYDDALTYGKRRREAIEQK